MKRLVLFCIAALTLTIAGVVYFNKDDISRDYLKGNSGFIFFGEDEWEPEKHITLDVYFGEDEPIEDAYIKVYSRDPYDTQARILASKAVNDYHVQLPFEIPMNCDCIYVMAVYTEGYTRYEPVPVMGGNPSVSFGIPDIPM